MAKKHEDPPTTGRIVRYRGKQGLHTVRAAIVTADVDTLDPEGARMGAVPRWTVTSTCTCRCSRPALRAPSTSSTCRPVTSPAPGTGRSGHEDHEA